MAITVERVKALLLIPFIDKTLDEYIEQALLIVTDSVKAELNYTIGNNAVTGIEIDPLPQALNLTVAKLIEQNMQESGVLSRSVDAVSSTTYSGAYSEDIKRAFAQYRRLKSPKPRV